MKADNQLPIETAPKDGSWIEVTWDYKPDYPPVKARYDIFWKAESGIIAQEPTHWRPLP